MSLARSNFWPYIAALALALVVGACGDDRDPTDPDRGPIGIIAGGGLTDTIMAEPVQALVIDVRDAAEGMVVRFEAVVATVPCPFDPDVECDVPTMAVGSPAGGGFGSTYTTTVSASGRAAAALRFGWLAGDAGVVVLVPELGLADTVPYTVLPGGPAELVAEDPLLVSNGGDTTVFVLQDRGGNTLEAAEFTILTPAILVELSGGLVTTLAAGIGRIEVGDEVLEIPVLPDARVLTHAADFTGPVITEWRLDGEGRRDIDGVVTSSGATRDPQAERWVHHRPTDEHFTSWRLYEVGASGFATPLDLPIDFQWASWPRFSYDGEWLYFEGRRDVSDCIGVWRVDRELTQVDSILTLADRGLRLPRVSADEEMLAALEGDCSPGVTEGPVVVFDLTSGDSTKVGGHYSGVAWAPDSERLAITGEGGTRVRSFPGGTAIGGEYPGLYDLGSVDWQPDGEWIITRGFTGVAIVVNASTG